MFGRKGRGFRGFGRRGWGRGWGMGRWGWGRGPWTSDEYPETTETRWGLRGSDVIGTPPPWAGFWGGSEPYMSTEERKSWLRAWRDHLKARLAEVEEELRRMGE